MKRHQLYDAYPTEAIESTKWHLTMLGKPNENKLVAELLEALVRHNPSFHGDLNIEDTIKAFYSAIHYGSHELKNATLSAHTRSLNAFLEARTSSHRPQPVNSDAPQKPDNWKYDPNEPLPTDITPERAYGLLFQLAQWRKGKTLEDWRNSLGEALKPLSMANWQHYIDKLKDRAKSRA